MLIVFGFCFIVYLFENLFALNVTELNSFVLQGKTRFTSGSDLFYDYEELKQDVAFRMKVSWFNESIVWGQTQTGQRFKLINRSESIQCLPIDTFDMIPMFFAVELATTEYPNAVSQ